jgi:epoxyqueuosine reductase
MVKAPGCYAHGVTDTAPLLERDFARRAGLGWFGKNANLLVPGHGSWFVLGTVLTDADVTHTPAEPVPDGCGTCARCLDACPTGAIVAPGVVDARRCLSWTLQTTGSFPRDQRVALGDRIYGCDDCQEVCPPNRVEVRRAAPGGRGEPVPFGDPDRAWVPVLGLLAASDDDLMAAHGRWYVPERQPRYLRRNALVVLGNVGDGHDPAVRAALAGALADPDPLLRAHAVWSARRLGCDDLLVTVAHDPDPDVQAELTAPVPTVAAAARS